MEGGCVEVLRGIGVEGIDVYRTPVVGEGGRGHLLDYRHRDGWNWGRGESESWRDGRYGGGGEVEVASLAGSRRS